MFHVKDGWYFERLNDGSVRVFKQTDPAQQWGEPPYVAEVVIDPMVWASVISSMSINGEANGGSAGDLDGAIREFYRALEFHNLTEIPEPEASNFMDSLNNVKVHTDLGDMLDEIKAYIDQHPGEIKPSDLPAQLMLGFIHNDGSYWAIKISDAKKSIDTMRNSTDKMNNTRAIILEKVLKSKDGRNMFCAMLSVKKFYGNE